MTDSWSLKGKITPHKLHGSYLEAVQNLKPESYNPNAIKMYDDLTDEQKSIDEYICKEIEKIHNILRQKIIEDIHEMITEEFLEQETYWYEHDIENFMDDVKSKLNKRFGCDKEKQENNYEKKKRIADAIRDEKYHNEGGGMNENSW